MAIKETVESAIAGSTITIFSKTWCPYCESAKSMLRSEFPGVRTTVIELDEVDDGDAIQEYLRIRTEQRTVPNIFINQSHVGGRDAVFRLRSQGKLENLVKGTQAESTGSN